MLQKPGQQEVDVIVGSNLDKILVKAMTEASKKQACQIEIDEVDELEWT